MVTVAIAGGQASIGQNIVRAILATTSHKVIILSRSSQSSVSAQTATVRVVDYTVLETLQSSLTNVDTVISCLAGYGDAALTAQLTLIEAARRASVRRFVPSDWATDCPDLVDAYRVKEPVFQAVRESGMEHTRFVVGIWMNVWGVGALHEREEALAGYKSLPFILNLKDESITIPGDGAQKIVVTTMQDVGRFVAASLGLPKWEPISRIVGDSISGNELVELVKKVTGREVKVTKISLTEISETLRNPELDFGNRFYYQLLDAIAKGRIDFEGTLNATFPHLQPTTVGEYLERHWTVKDSIGQ